MWLFIENGDCPLPGRAPGGLTVPGSTVGELPQQPLGVAVLPHNTSQGGAVEDDGQAVVARTLEVCRGGTTPDVAQSWGLVWGVEGCV